MGFRDNIPLEFDLYAPSTRLSLRRSRDAASYLASPGIDPKLMAD